VSFAVRQGLYAKLSGTKAITDLVGNRIYHAQAPSAASYPLIILNKQAGVPTYAMRGEAFKRETWMVKAVDRNTTSKPAEEIAEAVDAALNEGTITVTGKILADLRRTGDVDYIEDDGDQTYRHHGGLYRITLT
jgi:hypothetical protein